MKLSFRILHLEDDPNDAELVHSLLEADGMPCDVVRVDTQADFRAALEEGGFDIIFVDYTLPSFDGISALAMAKEKCSEIPLVFVSGTLGEARAIESLKRGARDYVPKRHLLRLVPVVRRALREAEERAKRRRAEAALRTSEERYRMLIENQGEGVAILDPEERFTFCNPAGEEIFGVPEGAMLGKSLKEFMSTNAFQTIREQTKQRRGGKKSTFEHEIIRPDGDKRQLLVTATPWLDDAGQFAGAFGVFRDITERKRAEDSLRESEERYRTLFEESKDVIFISSPEGRVLDINPAGVELFGYDSKEELLNIDIPQESYVNPEEREKYWQAMEQQGFVKDFELVLKRKDGQKLVVLETATAVRDETGAIVLIRGILRDVTEQRKLERQLLQAQKLESLGTLVGGVAHDFNNILTGIVGYTQMLLRRVNPSGKVYEGLARIEGLSERAADMVAQLLSFSREEVGQKQTLLLHPFLKELVKFLERLIPENIDMKLSLEPEDILVDADPTQLHQLFMNLVVNARDAMPGDGRLTIETALVVPDDQFYQAHPGVKRGRYVRISVSDTGVGIPPEIRSRIFDPFFTTKPMGKGTGLGLGVVYGIVKRYSGAIEVESEVGRGTTFQVYLPLAEKGMVAQVTSEVEVGGGTEMILLVEDEPIVLELGQAALEEFGYRVLTARNGLEAIAEYQAHQDEIALVVMDVVMPKMGGPEAFQELKRIDPQVKVLLATGYGSAQGTAEELLAEGVCGLVRKPYQIYEIARAVRAALASHSH